MLKKNLPDQFVVVLGITQDAGYLQAGWERMLQSLYEGKKQSLSLVWRWLTGRKRINTGCLKPHDIGQQLKKSSAIFTKLTWLYTPMEFSSHMLMHIGHYAGLCSWDPGSHGDKKIFPFGPCREWIPFCGITGRGSQLVSLKNIQPGPLHNDSAVAGTIIFITPIRVPHRDRYSETVGYSFQKQQEEAALHSWYWQMGKMGPGV